MASCRFCTREIPAGAKQCPACQRAIDAPDGEGETDILIEDEAYELGVQSTDIPKEWQGGATYMLELPAR